MTDPTAPACHPRRRRRGRTAAVAAGLAAALAMTVTACSDADSAPAGDDRFPEGFTLKVSSQQQGEQTAFELSGEAENLPFEIEWVNLNGGPAILEGIRSGSVDVGRVGAIPSIYAYASGDDVPVIAAIRTDPGAFQIATSTESDIEDIDDITPGTRIAFPEGTVHAGTILNLLDKAGLEPDEVEFVRVPTTEIVEALQANEVELGSLDGQRLARFLEAYEEDGAGVIPPEQTYGVADQPSVLYTSREALDDPVREEAIGIFLEHYIRAQHWVSLHPEEWVQGYFVDVQRVTEEDGRAIVETNGETVYPRLDDELTASIQALADLLAEAGELPPGIDASQFIDTRYSDVIESTVAEVGAHHSRDELD